jgi:hypothetical protein
VAKLAVIARAIIQGRFQSSDVYVELMDLQEALQVWRLQTAAELSLQASGSSKNIFAISLELL